MKAQSTTKGFAMLSAAGMMVKILSLLYVPFLLGLIGEDGYGVYYATYNVFAFIYILTNSGLSSAISKLVSELVALKNYKDAIKSFKMARAMMILIGLIMSIFMVISAKALANITNYPKAYLAIASLSPAALLTSIASAYRGYFQGRGDMKPTAVSQILEQVANIIFSLFFAARWRKYGVEAACAGATVGTTVGAFVSVLYLIKFYKKHKKFKLPKDYNDKDIMRHSNKSLFKRILYYSLPLTVSQGSQNAGNLIDASNTKGRLLAAGFSDTEGNVKYGYLGKYQTLINVPITIISALCSAVLPLISGAAALNDRKEVKRGVDYAFKTTFLIAIPSAVGLAVLSTAIFKTIYPAFSSGAYLLKYGSIVLVLMAIVQIQATILQSIGKLYLSTLYIIIGIVLKIIINFILVAKPNINILGAVFGSMAGFLVPMLLNNRLIKRNLKIRYNLISLASKPLIASAFMGVIVFIVQLNLENILSHIFKGYITRIVPTGVAILIGAFTYIYALILIGGISKKEIEIIPEKLKKFIPKILLDRIK
ncbi:stage V sporulation protein B [Clostridium sp. USBA 49]|jgi:stage V sporulation protein B|uniref:putative polysaccharide biosynthesis protein n=1 Tax=Clostridium TaxID=1485 RepID=UPI00099A8779|nr:MULTISPECIES: polysaccharide biosynthesis protein [Clostridium]SKA72865.1 stage V sporulation protein B [Clostridium sp. USBA 49]